MPVVSIVKGNDREYNITKALKMLEPEIDKLVENKYTDTLFIKTDAHASPEALEAVLDFFSGTFSETIISGEWEKNPYTGLRKKFGGIVFSKIREQPRRTIELHMTGGGKKSARISALPKTAFTVSLSIPKAHDAVVFGGCMENMTGCITEGSERIFGTKPYMRLLMSRLAKSNRAAHKNVAEIIGSMKPDLSVLDAYEAMEKNPKNGKLVEVNIAMCGADCVALDFLASKMLGFRHVPYIHICEKLGHGTANLEKIEISRSGFEKWAEICMEIKKHRNYKYQVLEKYYGINPIDFILFLGMSKNALKKLFRIIWENEKVTR